MAYQSLTLHMLISAPGDVDPEDMRAVHRTVNRWNFRQGRKMVPTPVTVVPVSWSEHAYSEFGIRPQESLNKQLVEEADLAFAMFADRLGTPTGEADSGTVEEMEVMRKAGKHVSLVHSVAARSVSGTKASEEKLRLETYLAEVKAGKGLVYDYATREDLTSQVEHVLSAQADAFARDAGPNRSEIEARTDSPGRGVWPRVDVTERAESDSKGRLKTRRSRHLVLQNRTGGVARNVRFRYENEAGEPEDSFDIRANAHRPIPVMAPDAEQRFPVLAAYGSAEQATCVVTWEDDSGEHETRATVRRF